MAGQDDEYQNRAPAPQQAAPAPASAPAPVYLKASHLANGDVEFNPVNATATPSAAPAAPAPHQQGTTTPSFFTQFATAMDIAPPEKGAVKTVAHEQAPHQQAPHQQGTTTPSFFTQFATAMDIATPEKGAAKTVAHEQAHSAAQSPVTYGPKTELNDFNAIASAISDGKHGQLVEGLLGQTKGDGKVSEKESTAALNKLMLKNMTPEGRAELHQLAESLKGNGVAGGQPQSEPPSPQQTAGGVINPNLRGVQQAR